MNAAGNADERATVVVPCRRPDELARRCLEECRRQCPGARILLVPDAGPVPWPLPAGASVLLSGAVSPAAKRNLAAREASTEFLALIDSDARPGDRWPAAAIALLESDATIGAVGGPNVPPPDEPLGRRVVGNASASFLVAGPFAYRKKAAAPRDCDHLSSSNLVVRRADYLRVGGMDEALETGEDLDFSARLRGAGLRIRYSPDVVVFHRDRDLRGLLRQRMTWGADCVSEWRAARNPENLYYFVSAAFLLFLAIGPATMLWPGPWWVYPCALGGYLAVCGFESVRASSGATEVPGTLLALLVGNLAPGAGVLARLAGWSPAPDRTRRGFKQPSQSPWRQR